MLGVFGWRANTRRQCRELPDINDPGFPPDRGLEIRQSLQPLNGAIPQKGSFELYRAGWVARRDGFPQLHRRDPQPGIVFCFCADHIQPDQRCVRRAVNLAAHDAYLLPRMRQLSRRH